MQRPVFADPKTDVVFKKIFGEEAHKDLLIALLNALLELDDAHRVIDIEYLSPEQQPPRKDLKLSILDVKCTDARGTRYVVEMQIIEVEGFQKRVVYNACKAYFSQLGVGQLYPALNDVIAVTVCDFALWPAPGEPGGVPMLSRWRMQEQHSGITGLPEVQYVFLELAKYPAARPPSSAAERWAYFFRETHRLSRVPEALTEAPFPMALEVARTSNMTEAEWTEYEREKMAEQDYRGGITLAEQRAEQRGEQRGELRRAQQAVLDLCDVLGLELTPARREELSHLDLAALETLVQRIKTTRSL